MILPDEIARLVRQSLPDATVEALDRTGTSDHYNLRVTSAGFSGLALLDRHRLVYAALQEALRDGRLHAVEITAIEPVQGR